MGAAEVEAFLTHLAAAKHVSASTRNEAKSAILFLYKDILGEALPWSKASSRQGSRRACRWS